MATKFILPGLLLIGALAAVVSLPGAASQAEGVPVTESPAPAHELPPDELVIGVDVQRGRSFGVIVGSFDLPDQALRRAALPHYDLSRIRPDRELQVRFVDGQDQPDEVRYRLDDDRQLVLSCDRDEVKPTWEACVTETPHTSRLVQVGIQVKGSLWKSLVENGLRPVDFGRLAQIFKYVVDFNSEVRSGDRFTLVAEMMSQEGREDRLGEIHAVRYEGREGKVEVVRFVHPNGEIEYYKPDGESLVKPFLRSPLEFYDVSSDFTTRRFHPVLHVNRAHTGTDLVASYGAPVLAVADGVVVKAGYNGSHGNYVEIKHDDVWSTSYSHLSRIAVRRGQAVDQSTRIGAVGATGLATGTHLHYQMWKDGRFVDPMKVELPLVQLLDAGERPAFDVLARRWMPLLVADVVGLRDVPDEEIPSAPESATPEAIAGLPATSLR